MRWFIIHPTHKRFLRLLRERYKEGRPVILPKEEVDHIFELLLTFESPTTRNQYVYRVVLRAMERSISEIQNCHHFYVLNKHNVDVVEKIYAKIERRHLCGTILSAFEISLRKKRV